MITNEQISQVFKIHYPTKEPYITQPFGVNWAFDYTKLGIAGHNGVDFRAYMKTPVYAVCDGVVTRVENGKVNDTTKGRYVYYETDPINVKGKNIKLEFLYFHLWSSDLKVGQRVMIRDEIGLADNTGTMSTGSHLHFQVNLLSQLENGSYSRYWNPYGGAIDPTPLFINNNNIMEFIKGNQNKLIQNTKTGQFGIVVGDKVLIASKERVAELALTVLARNNFGTGVTDEMWNDLPKASF